MKDDDVSALTFDVGSAIHIPPHHPLRQPSQSQSQSQPGPGQQLQQQNDESNDEFLTRLQRNLDELDIRENHHDDDDHPSGNDPPSPHDDDDDPRVSTGHLALIQETDDQVGHDGRETRLLMADLLREGLHDDDDDNGASNENDNQTLKKRKKEKKKSKKSHRSKSSKDSKRDRTSSSKKQSKKNSSSKDLIGDMDATRRDSDKRKEEMRLRKKGKRSAAAAAAMANDRPSSNAIEEFPLKEIRLPRPPSPSPSSDGEASDTNAERRSSFSVDSTAETAESTHSRSGQVGSRRLGTKEEEEEDRGGGEQENPFAIRGSNPSKSHNDHDETEEEEEEDSTTRLDHESLSRLSYFTEHTHDSSCFSHSRQPYPYQQRRSKQSRTLSQHSLSQSQRSLSQPSQSQSQSQSHAFHQSFGHASHSTYGNLSYNTHSTTTTTASHTHHLTHHDLLRLRESVAQAQSELRQVLQIKHRLESEIRALQTSLSECQSRHRERQVELRSSTEEMERFQFFLEKMERENARLRKAVGDMEEREDEERLEQVLGSMEEKMWKLRRGGGGGGSRRRSVGVGFGRMGSLGSVGGGRRAQAVLGKKDSVGTAAGKLEGNAMEAKVCPGIYSKRSSM